MTASTSLPARMYLSASAWPGRRSSMPSTSRPILTNCASVTVLLAGAAAGGGGVTTAGFAFVWVVGLALAVVAFLAFAGAAAAALLPVGFLAGFFAAAFGLFVFVFD